MADVIPHESEIEEIILISFDGTKTISLMAQMVELTFFESLFEPMQKAEMLLYDSVSLFNNFPLIGEEIVLIQLRQTGGGSETFAFVIENVENIIPSDKAREVNLLVRLTTLTGLVNARQNVMRAYHGTISNIIRDMMDHYVFQQIIRVGEAGGSGIRAALQASRGRDLRISHVEDSLHGDEGTICIPNMRPMRAATWLARRAVPETYRSRHTYMFWQANDGFHLETVQKLILEGRVADRYTYHSDSALVKKISEADQKRAITNLIFNNRISTLSKLAGGYFQNGLFEVNMQQLRYKIHGTEMTDYPTSSEGGSRPQFLNTQAYWNSVKVRNLLNGSLESINRVKYVYNNRMETDPLTPLHNYELRWGNDVRSKEAFSQVDLTITIYGDSRRKAGDLILLDIPRMEGFNVGDGNDSDKLLVGRYLVTDVKHQYLMGQHGSTVLRINKDDFTVPPEQVPFNYGNVSAPVETFPEN